MPTLNRKDRQELQDIVDIRINERCDKIMETYEKPEGVWELALAHLGLYEVWSNIVAARETYEKARVEYNKALDTANDVLEPKQNYRDIDSLRWFIDREVKKIEASVFNESPQAQQIKELEKQGRKFKTELLYATLPEEFKSIMERLDALVGAE